MSLFNWRADKKEQPAVEARTEPAVVAPSEPLEPSEPSESPRQGLSTPFALSQSIFYKHWKAISAEGITASQFIEFLQPFADLDGISVSYVYSDADGRERVYNRRRDDTTVENPLTVAIKEKKISLDQALALARNEEGRVWIESNFIDLK
ncbi:hypothetical protein ACSFA3_02925 [Variovorax sp. RHLX14]|uniref:hypothetical protein n=1 Tax=Variovorax sp. RHLX14 TaxID=1259731 RepID=UPI003F457C4D